MGSVEYEYLGPLTILAHGCEAMLSNVTPSLRSVSLDYGKAIRVRFVFESDPDDEEKDCVKCAVEELSASFEGMKVIEQVQVVPADQQFQRLRFTIYQRREKTQ